MLEAVAAARDLALGLGELVEVERLPLGEGSLTRWTGDGVVAEVVWVVLRSGPVDSVMLAAFTSPQSVVPHLACDAALICAPGSTTAGGHADLLPRVELASHLEYADECFGPLSAAAGAVPSHVVPPLPLRQRALMSPWAVTGHVPCEEPESTGAGDEGWAGSALAAAVAAYSSHWATLVRDGVRAPVFESDLVGRDRRSRAALFGRGVDPVWSMLDGLVGAQQSESLRLVLAGR